MHGNCMYMLAFMALGCSDASLKTFNAAPVAVITSHADDGELLEQEETMLRGSTSDTDHAEVELLTTWRVNGDIVCEDVVPEDDGSTACPTTLATGAVTVVLEVSDPKDATGTDSVSFTVTPNTPPDVSLTDPFEGERYYADEAIEFKGRVTDEQDAFDILTVSVESDLQGPLDLNTTLSGDGRFSDFGSLEAGTHIITVTATDSGGKTGRDQEEVEVLPGNSAPTIASVEISPDPATVSDVLSCIISGYEDADGDADESEYEWTVNGSVAGSTEILSDAFVAGDEVVCTVTPSDGDDEGEPLSDSITISNTPPAVDGVVITPDEGVNTSTTLTCAATFSDADGEELSPTYNWTIEETEAGTGVELVLSPDTASPGDTVSCTATVTDAAGDTATGSDTVTVGNTGPEMLDVIIEPGDTITTGTMLTCEAVYTDADGEALTLTYAWTRGDGTDFGEDSVLELDPSFATPGDVYTCTATVTDPAGASATGSDSTTVGNTAPDIITVDITPDSGVRASSILTCAAVAEDDDGDVPVITYAWEISGLAAGEGNTLDLSDTAVVTGEVVTCTATATDAIGDSDTGTDSVVIENTAPDLDSVTLSPEPVYTNDTLMATVSSSDAEDDTVSITYEWNVNDVMVAYGTDNTLSGFSHFDKGDEVYVVATPSDGMDDGDPLTSATLTVSNTPPTEPSVSIEFGCEDGWTEMPDGIRCAKAFDTSTDWRGSQANCESHGGTLVRIGDETDNDFVVDLYSATGADSVWFHAGMTDEAEEGTWVWLDGVDSAYRNWDPGQPDWDHEDCLEVVAGGWGNTTCDDTSYTGHVCQTEDGAGLTCIIDDESTDADGDAITYTFAWDFEGDAYTDTGSSTYDGDTVASDALSSDGTWTCTVTPNDGEEDAAAGSASYDFSLPEPSECTSLYFDGDDDMQVPASVEFVEFREGLTIESWVKWDGYEGHDWYPIATLGWGGDGSAARFFLAISGAEGSACSGLSGSGYLHFEVQTRPSLGACISSSSELVPGTWHHVAAVFDAGEARIYLDGELESSAATPDDLLRDVGPSDLKIGRVDAGAGTRFLGSMSNVRYSSAAQYDGNFVPDWPLEAHGDTVGLWPLDEGDTEDISGNEHHGVLSGGTWLEECPDIYDGCWTVSFDESTYVFCSDRLTRVDAEAECAALGMDLVKITDSAENDFVYSEAVDVGGWGHPGPWIGVQDKDLDGVFAWNDGEPLDYTEWCGAHPIDPGTRAYVHMEVAIPESPCWAANGSWDTTTLEYVCETSEPCSDASGETATCPGTDCLQILEDGHSTGDGAYWIDVGTGRPISVYCDMGTDDGGWTLAYSNFFEPGNPIHSTAFVSDSSADDVEYNTSGYTNSAVRRALSFDEIMVVHDMSGSSTTHTIFSGSSSAVTDIPSNSVFSINHEASTGSLPGGRCDGMGSWSGDEVYVMADGADHRNYVFSQFYDNDWNQAGVFCYDGEHCLGTSYSPLTGTTSPTDGYLFGDCTAGITHSSWTEVYVRRD